MTDMFQALSAPFAPDVVSWRVGSMTKDKTKAKALAYIDSRDVMRRLDEVVGPSNWQDRYEFHGARTVCYLSLRIDGEWITKADGAGDSDVEAEKGAISDALKRAAVKWGIARYLYDLDSPWVALDEFKRIAKTEIPALQRLLTGTKEPSARSSHEEFARIETALRNCQNLKALHTCWTTNSSAIANMAAGHRQALTEEKDRCKAILLAHEEVVA